jgi:arylsulfatase A
MILGNATHFLLVSFVLKLEVSALIRYNEINLEELAPESGGYSGYGGKVQTPALKSLAAEGMVFSSWYSGWHLCSPSRAACLTGRLPPRTGVPSVGRLVLTAEAVGGLPLNETTFAEALLADGYRTAMIGK